MSLHAECSLRIWCGSAGPANDHNHETETWMLQLMPPIRLRCPFAPLAPSASANYNRCTGSTTWQMWSTLAERPFGPRIVPFASIRTAFAHRCVCGKIGSSISRNQIR